MLDLYFMFLLAVDYSGWVLFVRLGLFGLFAIWCLLTGLVFARFGLYTCCFTCSFVMCQYGLFVCVR